MSGNFPLDGCSTDKIDFLFLYYDGYNTNDYTSQSDIARHFSRDILGSNKTTKRFAGVVDSFSVKSLEVNVSSWRFSEFDVFKKQSLSDVKTHRIKKNFYNNVNDTMTRKIEFVRRLFSGMDGVRSDSTHVAVIFIDGYFLLDDESRHVSNLLQQSQVKDIKIFVVVLDNKNAQDTVYARDTLIVGKGGIRKGVLLMAICSTCVEGWIQFHSGGNHSTNGTLSCYLFVYPHLQGKNWNEAEQECRSIESLLVKIETKEELEFLRTKIYNYINNLTGTFFNSIEKSQLSVPIFVGLKRDISNFAKRFRWSGKFNFETRPLVFNHWLSGKPSDGFVSECALWQFDSNEISSDDKRYTDGWMDVPCIYNVSSLILCEVTLPSRTDDMNIMKIEPAMEGSFQKALNKGNFSVYNDNIVSLSASIANTDFMDFFKQGNLELFPVFDCGSDTPDPQYISYIYVCDSVNHCSNRRDEIYCPYQFLNSGNTEEIGGKCFGTLCCDGSCLPLQSVGDGEVDCNVCVYRQMGQVNDESEVVVRSLRTNETCALFCDDKCVSFSKLNDSLEDCTGPDRSLDETIGKLKTADTCKNVLGHLIWAPWCVYVKDRFGAVMGCRDMSHLDNCTDFECPEGYLKCPNTYCIPQHYVLDGTADCPAGDDENQYVIAPCSENFACWNSKMCLHPDLVCDGHPDCPHKDDEVDCHVKCIDGLRCISGTAVVVNHTGTIATQFTFHVNNYIDSGTRFLNLSGIDLFNKSFFFLRFLNNCLVVIFSNCNIYSTDLTFLQYSQYWQVLDLSYNRLETMHNIKSRETPLENIRHFNLSFNKDLTDFYDHQLQFLETLDLSHTRISFLNTFFVLSFPSLKHLNLSFTKVSNIPKNAFYYKLGLRTLDLRGLILMNFYKNVCNGISISEDLYTDSFELCCPQIRGANIPPHVCHAPDIAIASCFHLVGTSVRRVLLWAVAVLAVVGNIIVISYRTILNRSVLWTGCGMFVTNLGISDLIMGVYLSIIAGADYYYRDDYVLYDKSWRESCVCKLAGFLVTLSSETSTFFIFLITLERLIMVKTLFGKVKFSKMNKSILLTLSWIIGFLLALTPIVFEFETYSSNSMCLGLPLTTERVNGWEFSFIVFTVVNFCLFLIIAYGQRAIFLGLSKNRIRVPARRADDVTVAKQLCLVALSNFLCWFPIGVMGLLSFSGYEISNDVYTWTTVIVLPINSAANPLLYTIPVLMSKWDRFTFSEKKAVLSSSELLVLHQ